MPFLNDLVVKSIRGTDQRKLQQGLVFASKDGTIVVARKDFITDYASIPKFLRSWIDQDSGRIRDAAVIHDYLYHIGVVRDITRKQADNYFFEGMRDLGMGWIKACAAWLAVRVCGSKYWNNLHN
ncbi:MAG: DUF1353 domain-containing protein [Candidatus Scalindua sp.]|nr:DUF1353 domain-containing protein [Candidatus Scalindua sp.]